jgi:hypothetical protein
VSLAWDQDRRAHRGHKAASAGKEVVQVTGISHDGTSRRVPERAEADVTVLQMTATVPGGLCAVLDDLVQYGRSTAAAFKAAESAAELRELREQLWPRDRPRAGHGADREWYAALHFLFAQGVPDEEDLCRQATTARQRGGNHAHQVPEA